MQREPHVLVLSTAVDASTDEVTGQLIRSGIRTTRLNTEEFPFGSLLTTGVVSALPTPVSITLGGLDLSDVTSIWYRRVRTPVRPNNMSEGVYDFCLRESRATVVGSVLAMGCRTMSPPANVWAAEHKLYQLSIAASVGLAFPDTVVTNDATQIRATFARFDGRMIAKPVRSGFVDLGHEQRAIYTSEGLSEHLDDLSGAQASPAIFQPLIPKRTDVRATFVGDRLFVAEIESQTDDAASVDWRRTENPNLPHRIGSLPAPIEAGARALMARLGLTFGALDFVRTPDDRWLFLEVNPNGQWLWLDDMLEFGITDAVAEWLGDVVPA